MAADWNEHAQAGMERAQHKWAERNATMPRYKEIAEVKEEEMAKTREEIMEEIGSTEELKHEYPIPPRQVELDPNGLDQHTPGAKVDAGKTMWNLLPLDVVEGVAKVMTFGATKYTVDGWKEVPQAKERYFSAMMRHWMAMQRGEYVDPDSGLPHWMHFCTNATFLGHFFNEDK